MSIYCRAIIGRSWGQGAQHSQSFHSFLSSIPGLTVLAPVTPHDMFNSIIWATSYSNPVIMVENRMLYKNKGTINYDQSYMPEIRKLEEGNDITILSISHSSLEVSRSLRALRDKNITADHFSLINLTKFSNHDLLSSAKKTGKILLIDNGWTKCSIVKDILSDLFISGFRGDAQIMGYANSPCPTPRSLEDVYYPNPTTIAQKILSMLDLETDMIIETSPEIDAFRGPF